MDHQDALKRLNEMANVTCLIDELLDSAQSRPLSRSAMAGLRVLLKNVRQTIVSGCEALESQSTPAAAPAPAREMESKVSPPTFIASSPLSDPTRLQMKRRDLRASLERIIEGDDPRP